MYLANLSLILLSTLSFVCQTFAGADDQYLKLRQRTSGRPNVKASAVALTFANVSACSDTYWLEEVAHQGISAFNPDGGYQVFRNVKDFGARGDGITDDTAAINLAISTGDRCAPGSCNSTTTTPAVVYFPAGDYLVSSSVIDYYYTQLIGNPNCMPTIRGTFNFTGAAIIDGDPPVNGTRGYSSVNVFWRQIRNLKIDMTQVSPILNVAGVHWPVGQATSLQNLVFDMSAANGTQHTGIFMEDGSGGFMNDLIFNGGLYGVSFGNQQYSMRNLTINNAVVGINQLWDWGWTYKNVNINNCSIGLNMSVGGSANQAVGSVTFFDSSIKDTPIGILTAHDATSLPIAAGSLILENVELDNVPVAVQGPNGTALSGSIGSSVITAWGEGHAYTTSGPNNFEGPITPNNRPGVLLAGTKFYEQSKPQYASLPASAFMSARSAGAAGDGVRDDTIALQQLIYDAAASSKIVFFDAGTYKVTTTLQMPPNSRWVGESFSVIMGSGSVFENVNSPQPIIKVGQAGEVGYVEWSDMIVSTQGPAAGAVLIEWNLATVGVPSGMWDVHARVGGFAGSNLQLANCLKTPEVKTPPAPINPNCIAAFMTMHITKSASNLYMENVWLWTADHDVEDPQLTQINVYNGRGLYIESIAGTFWLVSVAAEHHTLYQFQFANTQNIFGGLYQTETPYYEPNPNASIPFRPVASLNDPDFAARCANVTSGNCANAWGMRIINSTNILSYGTGFYSFFDNYSIDCSTLAANESCQTNIVSIEGTSATEAANVNFYNLNTVGTQCMISSPVAASAGISRKRGRASPNEQFFYPNSTTTVQNGIVCYARYVDNIEGFNDGIAIFRS